MLLHNLQPVLVQLQLQLLLDKTHSVIQDLVKQINKHSQLVLDLDKNLLVQPVVLALPLVVLVLLLVVLALQANQQTHSLSMLHHPLLLQPQLLDLVVDLVQQHLVLLLEDLELHNLHKPDLGLLRLLVVFLVLNPLLVKQIHFLIQPLNLQLELLDLVVSVQTLNKQQVGLELIQAVVFLVQNPLLEDLVQLVEEFLEILKQVQVLDLDLEIHNKQVLGHSLYQQLVD